MPCDCSQCSPTPRVTATEQHRRECEARGVLKMPKAQRVAYYEGVEKHRGIKGLQYLIEEVKRQYAASRNHMPPEKEQSRRKNESLELEF